MPRPPPLSSFVNISMGGQIYQFDDPLTTQKCFGCPQKISSIYHIIPKNPGVVKFCGVTIVNFNFAQVSLGGTQLILNVQNETEIRMINHPNDNFYLAANIPISLVVWSTMKMKKKNTESFLQQFENIII